MISSPVSSTRSTEKRPMYSAVVADRRPRPTSAQVSRQMANVARRDTRPELELRRVLHARGLRYRVDVAPEPFLRGRADILFRRARVAVYVDGCFWHSCPEHGVLPKGNRDWWRAKLEATVSRDRATEEALNERGWTVVRVWEHEDSTQAADRIEAALTRRL
jgi:DNA mismatch endonuclease, patch repair protein